VALQEAGGAAAAAAGGLGEGSGRPRPSVRPRLGVGGLQPRPHRAVVGRSGPGGQRAPRGVHCRRSAQVGAEVAASNGGGVRALAGLLEPGRAVQVRSPAKRVTSPASPLRPSSMASTANGIAAAIAWATGLGRAWATLPPMEASVPAMTRSQP
jgi:hypothetical protein